jgi:hypothetical protein
MDKYGFILLRHVNNELTNLYWNRSIRLIRKNYPLKKIIIIDDNSNYKYVKSFNNFDKIEVIQSEYPKRGELLPYIYFLKYKWFENAIIIHDSTFIHKRVNFEKIRYPILPIWHFEYDKENINNLLRISNSLNNSSKVIETLVNNNNILGIYKTNECVCVFGCQCWININFLDKINKKYNLFNLINVITCRTDRCALERVLGILFTLEFPFINKYKSLLGSIHDTGKWGLSYKTYLRNIEEQQPCPYISKVWTGR